MKRLLCIFLGLALLAVFPSAPVRAAAENPYLRIGIFTGSAALPAASLQNAANHGFLFGYLDENMNFVELGRTNESNITVCKNRSVHLSGGVYKDGVGTGANVVGAYHSSYGQFAGRGEAESKAASLRAEGVRAFVSYVSGQYHVRGGSFVNSDGGTRVTGSSYAVSVVVTGTTDIIFQFDGGADSWLCVKALADEGAKAISAFRDSMVNNVKYYGLFEYRRFDQNNLHIYNTVTMQDYIKGVVPNEMSASWPAEALKAQALCAKSYAARNTAAATVRHRKDGFSLCNGTHCQRYIGRNGATENSDRVVDEVYHQLITYNGAVCDAAYHSSNGGATENSENVWTNPLPYLRGVPDPYEDLNSAYHGIWRYTYTNEMLTSLLNAYNVPNTGVVDFYVSEYTAMGNVRSVTIVDSSGKKTVYSGEQARTKLNYRSLGFNTYSMRYTVNSGSPTLSLQAAEGTKTVSDTAGLYVIGADGAVSPLPSAGNIFIASADGVSGVSATTVSAGNGTYVVNGRGYGHNVGLSQWGAKGMAERGFNYKEILSYYYTGIVIANAS